MKKRSVAILGVVLVLLLLTMSPALAISGSDESDMKQAREIAQGEIVAHVDVFPEWQGAEAIDGQPYCNLKGEVICYWFAVSKEGKVLGNVVVGSQLYDHVVFKLGSGHTPSVPTADEVSACLEKDLGLKVTREDIGKPQYLSYVTYSFYFAIYEIDGRKIGIDLMRGNARPASDLQMGIASPEQYKQYVKEKEARFDLDESLPLPPSPLSLKMGIAPTGQFEQDKEEGEVKVLGEKIEQDDFPLYDMNDSALCEDHQNNNNCGPTSGSMIVGYYKEEQGYGDFDGWTDCHSDEYCDGGLYDTMDCNDWLPISWGVIPEDAGPGWIDYAEICGYDEYDDFVTRDEDKFPDGNSYEEIKSYIDIESPFMIMFQLLSPYTDLHWCALYGYDDAADEIWIADPQNKWEELNWPTHSGSSWLTYIRPVITSFDIPLVDGWNLISLPLVLDDAIADVLADVLDNVTVVYQWDNYDEEWLSYTPIGGGTLTTMEDGGGYWIYMNDPDTLTVEGIDTASQGWPPEYDVYGGQEGRWNMIGFTSPTAIYHEGYLDTVEGDYLIIYGYDTDTDEWFYPYAQGQEQRDGRLQPGYGYWIYMEDDGTIEVPWG